MMAVHDLAFDSGATRLLGLGERLVTQLRGRTWSWFRMVARHGR